MFEYFLIFIKIRFINFRAVWFADGGKFDVSGVKFDKRKFYAPRPAPLRC